MTATAKTIKPFGPEEAHGILSALRQPTVFTDMTCDWPVRRWTADHLSGCLGDKVVRFRLGRKDETNTPLFETQCSYVEAQLGQFLSWASGPPAGSDTGPFRDYPPSEYWAYADYKYIALLFRDQPSMFEDIVWADFGYSGRDGRESTVWIGTEGANTPCHLDSYGCNLVLQVQGSLSKLHNEQDTERVVRIFSDISPSVFRMTRPVCNHLNILYLSETLAPVPPEDTASLYPTRIPYEESSVFSQVDVLRPDLEKCPAFRTARAHVVTLHPGQVLFVPRHWWHYVESVDPVTVSVNTWIELEVDDDEARVGEAVTKAVVCALKTTPGSDNTDVWLNPTEDDRVASHDENMRYVNLAVQARMERERCGQQQRRGGNKPTMHHSGAAAAVKRDSSGVEKKKNSGSSSSSGQDTAASASSSSSRAAVPFGPHLIPVPPRGGERTDAREDAPQTSRPVAVPAETQERSEARGGGGGCETDRTPPEHQEEAAERAEEEDVYSTHVNPRFSITTNDLIDCLVHPDVVARVTELLLDRQRRGRRSVTTTTTAP